MRKVMATGLIVLSSLAACGGGWGSAIDYCVDAGLSLTTCEQVAAAARNDGCKPEALIFVVDASKAGVSEADAYLTLFDLGYCP